MNSTTIKVPTDSLPSIVSMLTDEITRLNDLLNTKSEKLSNAQYRISELSRIGVNSNDF